MRVVAQLVSPWQANCYLIAAESSTETGECVVVDPGIQGFDLIQRRLTELGWRPSAILLTHGHIDHAGDAHLLAAAHGDCPVYCAETDHAMLAQPSLGLGPTVVPLLQQLLGADALPLPADLQDHAERTVAGIRVSPTAAPGHTPGCTLLLLEADGERLLLSGDVVMAGSMGRTDFPGGSMTEMRASLRRILDEFPGGDLPVLPGHGPATTIGAERSTNPFLQPSFLEVQ